MASTIHHAVVKFVVSGDTLVITTDAGANVSQVSNNEQRISLSYITAPKLARPPTDPKETEKFKDEPYAFECREYLRKKLVGKEICYTIDHQVAQKNRLYCSVYLGNNPQTGEDVIESLLSEGLVTLRSLSRARTTESRYQRLASIAGHAKSNKRGRYSDDPAESHLRNMHWTLDDPTKFIESQKGSPPMDAVVEFIRDGNTIRCLLLPSYYLVTIQLTGIRCPILKRESNGTMEEHEPFAEEAKQYVEMRLLQRDVKIVFNGVSNQNMLGTVLDCDRNISLFLLKEGLAKCVDWTVILLPRSLKENYRQAEKIARDNGLRIWQDYIPGEGLLDNGSHQENENGMITLSSMKTYQAKVLEIIGGDALLVRDLSNNITRKIYLASVRAPRAADVSEKSANGSQTIIRRPLYEIPYLFDARESLRQSLIGKNVHVITEYIQPAKEEYSEKICCAVFLHNVNIGEQLISKGFATATRHREGDRNRSLRYDDLLTAQRLAEKYGLGVFSKNSGLHPIVDMTEENNKERAKTSLTVLQRTGSMSGVVEYVASGSRFRIHLLKNNWLISFVLSSVRCPRAARRNPTAKNVPEEQQENAEPFGEEALNFSREFLLQRDVIVDVNGMDRGGNFIGHLTTKEGHSAALMLVQAGLASVQNSTSNIPYYQHLLDVQEECKKQRRGIWLLYEETSVDEKEKKVEMDSELMLDSRTIDFDDPSFQRVVITYISSDLKIYVQNTADGPRLEQFQSALRENFIENKPIAVHTPAQNELLAARFSVDDQWYRARVEHVGEDGSIFVYFLDYGNREIITDMSRLATLPSGFSQLPGQAHNYQLAYVRPLLHAADREKAKYALAEASRDDECLIKVEYRQNTAEYISLYRATTKENLERRLVEQGLLSIGHSRRKSEARTVPLFIELEQAQTIAKAARLGIWKNSDRNKQGEM